MTAAPETFGTGSFRVFVADDDVVDDNTNPADGNGIILVRSIGTSTGNVRRMIEVELTVEGP